MNPEPAREIACDRDGLVSDYPEMAKVTREEHAPSNGVVNHHNPMDVAPNELAHGKSNSPFPHFPKVILSDSKDGQAKLSSQHDPIGTPNSPSRSRLPDEPYSEPIAIAICGLAFRLPGGIRDIETLWDALLSGKDLRSTVPPSRYNNAGFLDSSISQYGYFLDEDLAALDTSFFNMRETELKMTDPQQRQLLEVTRECLEDAGETDYRGKAIGCYVGTFGDDWLQLMCKDSHLIEGNAVGGATDIMLANRISYEYDFQGPSVVIKTGCSSSLVGLHEACRALQNGDCEAAIVAGANLIMSPISTAALSREGVISLEGSSKTFDASANGYGRGEAINAVFIKRLDDAMRDRNPIRAVIRSTGTNSDGRSRGLMTPNGKAQEALMRKVYSDCGLNPRDTAYVECHGTGTITGDTIETQAVGNVFGERGVLIGSVKPNVGHSEGASGITSLIKAVLVLENRTILPNIKFEKPNPEIPFKEKGLIVPVCPMPLPSDRAERISVSSYGIGGSNAHIIVDSLKQFRPELSYCASRQETQDSRLLVFSANNQDSLQQLVLNHGVYLEKHPENLADLSYTLALRREKLPFRTFSVYQMGSKLSIFPILKKSSTQRSIAMIFSGQGAQWPQMGNDLIRLDPMFRRDIQIMDDVLHSLRHPPEWSIEAELQKPGEESRINYAEVSQPLCTAIQIALVNIYARFGIFPATVIGHSSGEIAAVYAAGGLTLREAIIIAYYRGFIAKKQNHKGGMAAVGLGMPEVSGFLLDGVATACENSPTNVTISGDLDKIRNIVVTINSQRPDVLVRELKVDMAYHSNHMKPLAPKYLRLLQSELGSKFSTQRLRIPMFSTVLGGQVDCSSSFFLDYWSSNLLSPVLFSSAASSLLCEFPNALLLEIGPHSTLAGPLREVAAESRAPHPYIPTLLRFASSHDSLLSAIGQLYQHGVEVDFTTLAPVGRALCGLPTYPWRRASYWCESRISKEWRSRQYPHHPLLGQSIPESSSLEPSWRVVLRLEDETWLRDHKVRGDVIFPFAGFVAMAGEAMKQLSGIEDGYALRHVVVHTALVLLDSRPVEIFTNLRPHRLTDVSKSKWYDFSISSCTGAVWIEHCHGQIQAMKELLTCTEVWPVPVQEVPATRWYNFMKQVGIDYGPEFQRLINMHSSTKESLTLGQIAASRSQSNALFIVHPCILDSSFQLIQAASVKYSLKPHDLYIPTMVEELYISSGAEKLEAKAWISNNRYQNGVDCVANGKVTIRLRNMRFSLLHDDTTEVELDRHAAAYLSWTPDFDFIDFRSLFKPQSAEVSEYSLLEEMALLCILDSAARLEGITPYAPHLENFGNWLRNQVHAANIGTYPLVPQCQFFARLSTPERLEAIQTRYEALSQIPSKKLPVAGLMRLCKNTPEIFNGNVDPLEMLLQDNVLTELYNMVSIDCGKLVQALSNKKPNLRILEVGAGTGGTTAKILSELLPTGSYQNPPYSLYTFTDISAGFFDRAKERFSGVPNMDYLAFDISKDPLDQGFEPFSYDLIIASNCVHATSELKSTLRNLHSLLRPDGYLLLSELSTVSKAPGYLFGVFSGWWSGEMDNRKDAPFVSLERWDMELKGAGFTGASSSAFDNEEPYQYCAAIMAQPSRALETDDRSITVLCDNPNKGVSRCLINHFRSMDFEVSISTLEHDISKERYFISTFDLENPFFDNITEERFGKFQNLLRHSKVHKLLWLLPPSQVRCRNPFAAKSLGMLRIIRTELAIPITTLEISENEIELPKIVASVFRKIRPFTSADNLLPDMEFAFDDDIIKTGRFHPFSLETKVQKKRKLSSNKSIELDIKHLGLLDTLRWIEKENHAIELKEDKVEVETRVVGMNFRDLALTLGLISSPSKKLPLGLELSGIVRRVGSGVSNVSIGDRVFALAEHLFVSTAIVSSSLVAKIPDDLSFEDAATMPCCFGTVIRSLIEVGQLEKDQTILIHSACSGVGQAAIQISKFIGAKIFVTVSSEAKAGYLVETFGIPRDHIFHSRDESFLKDLLRATKGRGVDLVLNFLSGELLHASWKCVAKFGKLVELGKRDLAEFGRLDMEPFLGNRSYCCVDLAQIMLEMPERITRILKKCLEMYRCGAIGPIRPVAIYEASDIEKAFRHLEGGNHIGKVVIQMPHDLSTIPSIPNVYSLQFDRESSYLITGGLGGLGKILLTWMVERGARNFILISRTAGLHEDHRRVIDEMEAQGCSVEAIAGQVQNEGDVARAIAAARKPIRGIIHLAMVIRDAPILDMTFSEWTSVTATKCIGAWNLHNALQSQTLDFFVLASSIAAQIESPGQGNYAAANTFLEAFCQFRRSLGLSASVISMCPIDDAGFVAENPAAMKSVNSQGINMLSQSEFLDYMELAILNSKPDQADAEAEGRKEVLDTAHWNPIPAWSDPAHLIMGLRSSKPLSDPKNPTSWRHDRRMGFYHNIPLGSSPQKRTESQLTKFLNTAHIDTAVLDTEQAIEFLATEIGNKIFTSILRDVEDVNLEMTIRDLGLDSLVAIELRRWWRQTFGTEVSVLEIMGVARLVELGRLAAKQLAEKLSLEREL